MRLTTHTGIYRNIAKATILMYVLAAFKVSVMLGTVRTTSLPDITGYHKRLGFNR